jgi:hypothetical protein
VNQALLQNIKILLEATMIVKFMEDKQADYDGRYLHEMWNYNDTKFDSVHDFIQWMFPLDTASKAVLNAPVLFEDEIYDIRESELAKRNLLKSAERFLNFLYKTNNWENRRNHNHKRISRMISSLRLLHSNKAADQNLMIILDLAISRSFASPNVIEHWKTC